MGQHANIGKGMHKYFAKFLLSFDDNVLSERSTFENDNSGWEIIYYYFGEEIV